jgi:uncharacterized protein YndB with AHSA1/START domain
MSKARMGDAAVHAKTGKDWKQWFSILDKADATKMTHKEMAEYLYGKQKVPGWWSQMIAVTYEQERGLREKHQQADGYSVSASKTVQVPLSALYERWSDEKLRSKWLRDKFTVSKETRNKSIRIKWPDKTSVEVYFYKKSESKSQVNVQHGKLADAKQVERMRAHWKAALDRLEDVL